MKEYNSILLARRIKEVRLENHLSQTDLANKIGVTRNSISQYERGVTTPNIDKLFYMAQVMNVSLDYISGLTDI